jgi:predicted ferric reductase
MAQASAKSLRHYRTRVPLPRVWPLRLADLVGLVSLLGLLVVGMWVRHGGLAQMHTLPGILTGTGQLAALLGTYLVLIQLVLMSRSPFLDQLLGMDRLALAHKWVGFSAFTLIFAHLVFTTAGYAAGDGSSFVGEFAAFLTSYPWVLAATVGFGFLTAVAVSSIRAARQSLSYETWYFIHLGAYLAISLSFAHQLAVGVDFIDDPVARFFWIGLYALTFGLIATFRFGAPVRLSLRHRLRVERVVREAPGVVSVYVGGAHLESLPVRAGQYFLWRFATGGGWWRAHPFSLSAAPNGRHLRLTIKELGDWSGALQRLRPGVRVFAEGPYGIFTRAVRTRDKVLLLAGGIGITPLRALFEELPGAAGTITLIYRASSERELVFRAELDALATARGARVVYIVGPRGQSRDPLGAAALAGLVPDLAERDIFMCGPSPLMLAVNRTLRQLGVPAAQVHWERFSY